MEVKAMVREYPNDIQATNSLRAMVDITNENLAGLMMMIRNNDKALKSMEITKDYVVIKDCNDIVLVRILVE